MFVPIRAPWRQRLASEPQYKDHLLNQALMNPHLIGIPCLASLTTRRLPSGDLQTLRGQADRTLNAQILRFGTFNQLLADFFKGLNFARSQGDADLVDFLYDS